MMKRIKESGASFRKKKKAREEIQNTNTGALLKYISRESIFSSFNIVASSTCEEADLEGEKNSSNVAEKEIPACASHTGEEVESSSSSDKEFAAQIIPYISMKDVGLWPNKIDDNTRVFLYAKVRLKFKI